MGVLIDSLYWSARLDLSTLDKDMLQARRKLADGTNTIEKEVKGGFGNLMAGIGGMMAGIFSIQAIAGFIKGIVSVRSEFEKYEAVLTNTLGSGSRAQMALQNITDFAAKTPFQVTELTSSFVKLANQGFEPTLDEMRKLGDLASSTGKGFDQLTEGILDAMMGQWERMKEFGIKASQEGDKVTATFKGQKTTFDNTAEGVKNYILSLGELKGVSGSMEAISKTLGGQLSNLKDSWDQLLNHLGGESSGVMVNIITWLSDFVKLVDRATAGLARLQKEVDLKDIEKQAKYNLEDIQMMTTSMAGKGIDYDVANKKATEFVTKPILDRIAAAEKELEIAQADVDKKIAAGPVTIWSEKKRAVYNQSFKDVERLNRELFVAKGILENMDKATQKSAGPAKTTMTAADKQAAYAKQMEAMKKKFDEFNAFARTFGLAKAQKAFGDLADSSWRAYLDRLAKKETDPELQKIIAVNLAPLLAQDKLEPIKRKVTPFVPYQNTQLLAKEKEFTAELHKHLDATRKLLALDKEREKAVNTIVERLLSVDSLDQISQSLSDLGQVFSGMNGQLGNLLQGFSELASAAANIKADSGNKGGQVTGLISGILAVTATIRDWRYESIGIVDPLQLQEQEYEKISNWVDVTNEGLERQKGLLDDMHGENKLIGSMKLMKEYQTGQTETFGKLQNLNVQFINKQWQEYKDSNIKAKGLNKIGNFLSFGGQAQEETVYDFKTIDTGKFKDIEDYRKLLNEIKASGGMYNGKKVVEADVKALTALVTEYDDFVEKNKEIKTQIDQLLTGTTAQAIADSIDKGFESGLDSAEDFGNNLNDIIRQQLVNAFQVKYIEQQAQDFYDEFAELSQDGLTQAEKDKLKTDYDAMIALQQAGWEDTQKMMGDMGVGTESATGKKQAGLAGAIKGITEETADVLAGQIGAIRVNILEGLETAKAGLLYQQETAVNTRRLLAIENYLGTIALGSGAITKDRANGR